MRFLYFWYPHALKVFLRIWKNTISVLEEDLGVGIMWRLLFTPLFHDSTFSGRIMSFFFRLTRIFVGLIAYLSATIFILILALIWFLWPLLLLLPQTRLVGLSTFTFAIALFLDRVYFYPKKRVYQLKSEAEIWSATKLKAPEITWTSLTKSPEIEALLSSLELTPARFIQWNGSQGADYYQRVVDLAKAVGAKYITPAYFWVVMFLQIPGIENQLLKLNLKPEDFTGALNFLEHKRLKWRKVYLWDEDFGVKHLKGTNRGWLGAPTPNLDTVSQDLTKEAASRGFDDFIGREKEVQEVVTILSTQTGRNVLLVAPPGSGKSGLVNYLAKMIVTGDAPKALANKRLVSLDTTKLLAGVSTEGDLAEKVKAAFEDVKFVQEVIVYVDEIQNLGMGDAGTSYNLYSLMLPYLESNGFQFLASTEPENYTRIVEKNGAFARLFAKVYLPPATVPETIQVIQEKAIDLARFKKIDVTYLAIRTLVELANRLIHDRVLPDSALSILNEAVTIAQNGRITIQTVKDVFSKKINVPINDLGNTQKEELLNLEGEIHKRMIDQVEAVNAIGNTLRRAATALREQNRPIGSFLFVGPTGVGKTELAKALAQIYFKDKNAFLRFDMSEYQTPEAVNRLLGDSSNPGELTQAVRSKPYSLVLLDEFEKADTKITTLFLQVLDDGRLTDSSGRMVDFTNTIIIATSNAGSLFIAQGLEQGKTIDQIKQAVNQELLKVYKPELVNRFDEVVVFKPLSRENLQQIVLLKLKELQEMLKSQGYLINFTPDLITGLSQKGFDPVLGARPLRRLIQDTLESKLSRMILEGKLIKGQGFKVGVEILS